MDVYDKAWEKSKSWRPLIFFNEMPVLNSLDSIMRSGWFCGQKSIFKRNGRKRAFCENGAHLNKIGTSERTKAVIRSKIVPINGF